jgi:hypothetical protein
LITAWCRRRIFRQTFGVEAGAIFAVIVIKISVIAELPLQELNTRFELLNAELVVGLSRNFTFLVSLELIQASFEAFKFFKQQAIAFKEVLMVLWYPGINSKAGSTSLYKWSCSWETLPRLALILPTVSSKRAIFACDSSMLHVEWPVVLRVNNLVEEAEIEGRGDLIRVVSCTGALEVEVVPVERIVVAEDEAGGKLFLPVILYEAVDFVPVL